VFARAIVIVLDSVGIGELPDAALYEDQGSNTLGNIAAAVPLNIPTLAATGMSRLVALKICAPRRPRRLTAGRAIGGEGLGDGHGS
jgi:phosphopentomutase